jgi:hypothetical protein
MTDPTSRQRGRPKKTRQQLSDNNLQAESNIWWQVPEWARYRDIMTDWPSVVMWLSLCLWQVTKLWLTKDRPVLSSERAHHRNRTAHLTATFLGGVSDETVKYGYGFWATLTIEWLHCKLQTHALVREGAPQIQDRTFDSYISWGSLRWDSTIWLRVLSYSDHWVITLQIADPCSRQSSYGMTELLFYNSGNKLLSGITAARS